MKAMLQPRMKAAAPRSPQTCRQPCSEPVPRAAEEEQLTPAGHTARAPVPCSTGHEGKDVSARSPQLRAHRDSSGRKRGRSVYPGRGGTHQGAGVPSASPRRRRIQLLQQQGEQAAGRGQQAGMGTAGPGRGPRARLGTASRWVGALELWGGCQGSGGAERHSHCHPHTRS